MAQTLDDALTLAKGPLSKLVLQYAYVMKGVVEKGKEPGFTAADWAPLAEGLVATDEFERVGNFREKVDWAQYAELLTMWAKRAVWGFTVRRVTEGDGYAILELEEYAHFGDHEENYTTVSVYEFNAENKLNHLEIYLAKEAPPESATTWDFGKVGAEYV